MAVKTKARKPAPTTGARVPGTSAQHPVAHAPSAPRCGCGADASADGRKAVGVDASIKDRNLVRLRRIEGQVRGLQRMVESERYCADILTQITSVHEALRGVSRELLRNHLKHCATEAIRSGDAEADAMYDELVDLMHTHSR